MLTEQIKNKLKERYSFLHPLLIHRSCEKASSDGEFFDILDSVPKEFPLIWNEESHRWTKSNDILQTKDLKQ